MGASSSAGVCPHPGGCGHPPGAGGRDLEAADLGMSSDLLQSVDVLICPLNCCLTLQAGAVPREERAPGIPAGQGTGNCHT